MRTIPDSVSRNVVPDMSSLLETTAEQAAQLAEQFVSADGTGRIAATRRDDNAVWYTVETPAPLLRYIVEKGSITIDGISLTVAAVEQDRFSVSLIPHTAQVTILGEKGPGDTVNLETDIIGKYVEKLLQPAPEPTGSRGVTLEFLAENGF